MSVRLPTLSEPYEILELADGKDVTLQIARWELGLMTIRPRYPGAPATKEIQALRLHVSAGRKILGPPFWDVTSQTLIAQLKPHLDDLAKTGRTFRITAHGEAPRKRFTLELL